MIKNQEQAEQKIAFLKNMLGKNICAALENDDITEIMVNPDGFVWLESRKEGIYRDSELHEDAAQNFLLQLANLRNLYLNFENPYIETILPFNRERIEGTISPITDRASFTIRKPAKFVYSLEDYLKRKIINQAQFDFISESLVGRKFILVSGGPGTGKTTLTNAIIKKMGEVRDSAALDLLKSWNTGCPGGIATIHANSDESSLLRLLSLAQEANVPPPYELIAETIDVLVNIVRDPGHPSGRVVKVVSEMDCYDGKKFQLKSVC